MKKSTYNLYSELTQRLFYSFSATIISLKYNLQIVIKMFVSKGQAWQP
jgi:hypothetical protein